MHIGHINTNQDWGGGENQVLHLALGLMRHGVQVTLFVHPKGALLERAREAGCTVCPLPEGGRRRCAVKTADAVAASDVDLLHVHDSRGASLGPAIGRRLRCPVVLSRRVASPLRRNPFSRWKYSHRNFQAVIAISNTVRDVFLKTSRFPAEAVYVVPSGVDIGELDSLELDTVFRRQFPGRYLAGGVGKLSLKKNWPFLVRVAAEMAQTGLDVHWIIAGDGPEHAAITALAADLGVEDRVHLLGFRSDALRILKSLDVLFFPSRVEGASVTVRECMVLGTPVVAVNADGTMESLAGHGWEVNDGDVAAGVRCVTEALTDPVRRGEHVSGARRYAIEQYNYDRTVAGTLNVYRAVLT